MNLLVLTDHRTHNEEDSFYLLLRELLRHSASGKIDVASRGVDGNKLFFEKMASKTLYGTQVHAMFSYREDAYFFRKKMTKLVLRNYDGVLTLLPYPVPDGFWEFLEKTKSCYPRNHYPMSTCNIVTLQPFSTLLLASLS